MAKEYVEPHFTSAEEVRALKEMWNAGMTGPAEKVKTTGEMLTFEQAYKKAKKLKPSIDNCTECTDAYVFGCYADSMSFGGDGPCVILKESGKAINMTDYLVAGCGQEVRNIELPK